MSDGHNSSNCSRRGSAHTNIICTRRSLAAKVPRGEQIVEAAKLIDDTGLDGIAVDKSLSKSRYCCGRRFPGATSEAGQKVTF